VEAETRLDDALGIILLHAYVDEKFVVGCATCRTWHSEVKVQLLLVSPAVARHGIYMVRQIRNVGRSKDATRSHATCYGGDVVQSVVKTMCVVGISLAMER
jgi:hypothetical protein